MTKMLLVAAVAALAATAPSPALAKPAHAGHGKHGHDKGAHALHDMDPRALATGRADCPPGLAKKNNGCLPPGQAKKLYDVGQRYPYAARSLFGYNQLPQQYRTGGYDPYGRYAYDNGTYYRVDPTTMVIQQVLGAILR